ncbi:two-component system, OmpR family, sensor histidine kinase TorS [Candidatus Pantoea floridensis]|uniref:histidine kinase n=2 Tax=Candidatus Pantoea floridensis TaxID=1938870 RepID=A0A286BT74_9GAMM|nr:two-component system sensor histidine kinase TorS [Enterobacteriaceae bacterium JKS000233]SOD37382.1 two-component system, OmpR family, sensor histidine kinase TorS [Pantoea floridensis]
MLVAFARRTQLFLARNRMANTSLIRRLWLAFALMALLTLLSVATGWLNLRYVGRVEQADTQSLLSSMNMARHLSVASARVLFSAQQLLSAQDEQEWQVQRTMLGKQSQKIVYLLHQLSAQGFDTRAMVQLETANRQAIIQQGDVVHQRLQLTQQQRQLSDNIGAAAHRIVDLAQGQASNAATAAGATQAGIYDLIEQQHTAAAGQALDRLIDVDLEYLNQMGELRLIALRVEQIVMTLKRYNGAAEPAETPLAELIQVLHRRQQRVEDPRIRQDIREALAIVAHYTTLLEMCQQQQRLHAQLATLSQQNFTLFSRFSSEMERQVSEIEQRNAEALSRVNRARVLGTVALALLGVMALLTLSLVLWRLVYRSVSLPLARQTDALQRLLDGDLDSPFPSSGNARELNTISRLMEAFRTNVRALQYQQQHLAELVKNRTEELQALVVEHHQARADAEQANRAKSAFLAAMSHEIRTPLHGILGTAQLLADQPLNISDQRYVQAINDSGETLLFILNDILDYSAIESSPKTITLHNAPFEPRQLLGSVAQLMNGRAHKKGLALNIEVDAHVPEWIQGDVHRLRQIVMNLVMNALRFTENGAIVLRMKSCASEWFIEVDDEGCGIAHDHQEAIFAPFVQLQPGKGGTGLGLAICRGLAQAMQGQLTVTSQPEVGSCFRLTLPLVHASATVLLPDSAPADLSHLHVLIIEDNPLTQQITAEMLKRKGARVSIAGSAESALAFLAQGDDIDCALVDFALPDANGIELAQKLAQFYPATRRIGFSASVPDELQPHADELFCGIIQKPVHGETLCRQIVRFLASAPVTDLNANQLKQDYDTFGADTLRGWLALFRQHAMPLLDDIESAEQDEIVSKLAHQLKSSCGSLGMQTAWQACARLEQDPQADIPLRAIVERGLVEVEAWIYQENREAQSDSSGEGLQESNWVVK